ncbi:MAG: MFS transporter [Dethiobacter sp.]|nr:MFS transporter [Dethiobacter sp.]
MTTSLILINFIVLISFFDTLSLLPLVSPFAVHLGASSLLAGIIVSAYSFANFSGNLISGYFIDGIGRKFTLILGLLIAGTGVFSYTLAQNAGQLIALRIIHGLGGALLVPAAFTLIADKAPVNETPRAMGRAGALIGVSALIGPPVSGIMRDRMGFNSVFILIAGLFALTLVLVFFFLPGDTAANKKQHRLNAKQFLNNFVRLTANAKLFTACIGGFSLMWAQGVLAFLLPLYIGKLGYLSVMVGALLGTFAVFAIVTMLFSKLILPKFKHPDSKALAGIGLCLILIPFFSRLIILFFIMAAYGVFFGTMFTYSTNSVAKATVREERGTAFSIFYACFSLGVVFGPVLSGLFPLEETYLWGFVGGGSVTLISGFMLHLFRKSRLSISTI